MEGGVSENLRQIYKLESQSRVSIAYENSLNPQVLIIRCVHVDKEKALRI